MNKEIPIFLASDDNYSAQTAVTIASMCHNSSSQLKFYILDSGITIENKKRINKLKQVFNNCEIEFLEIDMNKAFPTVKYTTTCKNVSFATYNRFLVPYIKPEIKKALYSDVDVIAMGDIAQMFEEDIENYAIGAVWEEYAEGKADRKSWMEISEEHKYFYAGNIILNCELWRKKNIFNDILKLENIWREKLRLSDMDLLNKYFDCNNYKQLPAKYCYLNEDYEYRKEQNPEIIIRHFAGLIKPWKADFYIHPFTNKPHIMPNVDDFWEYAKMTDFYDDLIQIKTSFLASNILWTRYNQIVKKECVK